MTDHRTSWHPAAVLIGLVMLLPLMPAIPLWTTSVVMAITGSPLYVFTIGLLLMFAAWIGAQDRWLGALAAWVSVSLLWTPTVHAFEVTEMLVLSACVLMMAKEMSSATQSWLVTALVAAGLLEVLYGAQQWLGYDVLWHGLQPIVPVIGVPGTMGNSNYYGVYLAMIAPLAPWWAVPFFMVGIVLSHSLLAASAVSVALLWRLRGNRTMVAVGVALAIVCIGTIIVLKGAHSFAGMVHRVTVWSLALGSLSGWQWLVGVGPGSWASTVPALQVAQQVYPNEVFLQGHSEWVQILYEHGIVAILCLSGWLWAHKQAWIGPYGPALFSVFLCSFGMFGMRLAVTGCVALAILSLSISKEGEA